MLLPFTTGEWNAVRFVALSLVCVPLIEKALHRLHQLRAAHRLLNSKPARIRPSKLGNWGLHQEVDELSFGSKFSMCAVVVLYVGLSLYTEYASESHPVPVTQVWEAPVSTKESRQGKLPFYDTYMIPVGSHSGCASKDSRIEMHELYEKIVIHDPLRSLGVDSSTVFNGTFVADVYEESSGITTPVFDNGSHLLFAVDDKENVLNPVARHNRELVLASMDDEALCLSRFSSASCIPTTENISVAAVIGNLLHFQESLLDGGRLQLVSHNAFDVEGSENATRMARAHTRTEFLHTKTNYAIEIHMRFKYGRSTSGENCLRKPQLQFNRFKIPQHANLSESPRDFWFSMPESKYEQMYGIFQKKLVSYSGYSNSSIAVYLFSSGETIYADNHGGGAMSLIGGVARVRVRRSHLIMESDWKITFKSQDANVADLARSTVATIIMSRELFERRPPRTEAEMVLKQLNEGLPKLQRIGVPGSEYNEVIRQEERATMITWVLVLWVGLFILALLWLCFTNLMKPGLLPDVDFLYRRAVMQQHSVYNCGKSICNAPTVRMRKTGKLVKLIVSYEENEDREKESRTVCGDHMI